MDELKKKVEELTPQNAFYAYFGVAALVLLLWLVAPFVGQDGETANGINVLFGKSYSFGKNSVTMSFGTGTFFGFIYILSLLGVLYLAYTKKVVNYIYTLVPFVALFICAFTCKASLAGISADEAANSQFLAWVEIILMAALVGFAYLRGTAPVALDQKK